MSQRDDNGVIWFVCINFGRFGDWAMVHETGCDGSGPLWRSMILGYRRGGIGFGLDAPWKYIKAFCIFFVLFLYIVQNDTPLKFLLR